MQLPKGEQWLYLFNILITRWINSGKNIVKYTPKNIVCIKWDEIGDVTNATHVFVLLKMRFPEAKIDVITKPYSAGLMANNPAITNIYTSIDEWKMKYDMVVELRGTWRTLWKSLFYYPKVRLDRGTVRFQNKGNQTHESLTNYSIIKPILGEIKYESPHIFTTENDEKKVSNFLNDSGIVNFCVMHVGARRELRRWNSKKFALICQWIHAEYGYHIVFAGTKEEENQIAEVTQELNVPYTLFTNNFSLTELAVLCGKASLFIGNESGPLQIADCMQTPLVALFGPGVPNVFYPRNPKSKTIHHVLQCSPCDQIHCVRPQNTCMDLITEMEVKSAIIAILQEGKNSV